MAKTGSNITIPGRNSMKLRNLVNIIIEITTDNGASNCQNFKFAGF